MRFKLVPAILLLLLTSVSASAQTATKSEGERPGLVNELKLNALAGSVAWSYLHELESADYGPHRAPDAVEDLRKYVTLYSDSTGYRVERIVKYAKPVEDLLSRLTLFGGELAYYGYKDDVPVTFADFDGKEVLIVKEAMYGSSFNTLRTDARSRVAQVITEIITGTLSDFHQALSPTTIPYYGFMVTYGVRDFSDKYARTRTESVGFIARAEDVEKFVNAEITEEELVEGADIYINPAGELLELRKIKVTL